MRDLFRYSAKWWSYLVPPVEHPLLGDLARRVWIAAGVREGLLEQQVSLGWGIVALGLVAIVAGWLRLRDPAGAAAARARVPVLVIVAVAALVCSLSPERTIGGFTFVRPSALLYDLVPMFRSYARFGVVVQLMAALLAGIGVDYLRRAGTRRAQIVCVALVALAAGEYAVAPSALWRDVLPDGGAPLGRAAARPRARPRLHAAQSGIAVSSVVDRLSRDVAGRLDRATARSRTLSQKLAAIGYTHLLVRRDTADGQWFAEHPAPDGLRVAARFDDGQVFAVTARTPRSIPPR